MEGAGREDQKNDVEGKEKENALGHPIIRLPQTNQERNCNSSVRKDDHGSIEVDHPLVNIINKWLYLGEQYFRWKEHTATLSAAAPSFRLHASTH